MIQQRHSVHPNAADPGSLPGTGVEVGDTCYSISDATIYVCTGLFPTVWAPVGAGGGGAEQLDIGVYTYSQTDPAVEETVNYGYFDGDVATNPVFWAILTPSLSAPGTTYVRIYDVGPIAGPPAAPVLVAELSTATSGGPQYLEQVLAIGAGPALNQIQNTERMYSVRVYQLSVNGDSVLIGAGGLADR